MPSKSTRSRKRRSRKKVLHRALSRKKKLATFRNKQIASNLTRPQLVKLAGFAGVEDARLLPKDALEEKVTKSKKVVELLKKFGAPSVAALLAGSTLLYAYKRRNGSQKKHAQTSQKEFSTQVPGVPSAKSMRSSIHERKAYTNF
jgi:hypothetical protein